MTEKDLNPFSLYKEAVITNFYNLFPKFFNKKNVEFDMRDICSKVFNKADAFISSHLTTSGDVLHDIEKLRPEETIKQVNEIRKLIEFAAFCVNDQFMKEMKNKWCPQRDLDPCQRFEKPLSLTGISLSFPFD